MNRRGLSVAVVFVMELGATASWAQHDPSPAAVDSKVGPVAASAPDTAKASNQASSPLLPCVGAPVVSKLEPKDFPSALREARLALEELRYEDALGWVSQVGATAPPALRIQALEIAATVHLVIGRTALAEPLLEELYHLAPGFLLDDPALPPRVTKMFDEEAARPHKRAVRLRLGTSDGDVLNQTLLTHEHPHAIEVRCRSGVKAPYVPVGGKWLRGGIHVNKAPAVRNNPSVRPRQWRFRLPAQASFQCHAVAVDRDALPLGRLGTASAPLVLRPRALPPPPPPIYKRWFFWTGLGAVVVGGVVASVVVASSDNTVPPTSELTVGPAAGSLTLYQW